MSTTQVVDPEIQKAVKPRNRRGRAFFIFFAVLLVLGAAALLYWLHSRQFEETDDAQVDAHLAPVTTRIDGTVTRVYVDDNQVVKAGDPIADLDPRDFQVSLHQAQAALAQAHSLVTSQQPSVPITEIENTTSISTGEAEVVNAQAALAAAERDRQTAAARLLESQANNERAQADLARYKILIAKEEVSQQEFDQAAATAKAQAATVAANQASVEAAEQTVAGRKAQLLQAQSRLAQSRRNAPHQIAIRQATVESEQANAQSAQTQVEGAQLKLSYTKIVAPVSGIVLSRSAEPGVHLSAGQQLLQIAIVNDLWVTANFKETQLRHIQPGQSVSIHVDAIKTDFDGTVESVGGATGAVASVLPPENATGNYVKIVQRIPVRIRFKPDQKGLDRLRPGMSVEPQVRIGG
jgi:membrane fusion protein (multidrug efflux system)